MKQKNSWTCDVTTGECSTSKHEVEVIKLQEMPSKIKILYYTDPICSACWGLEPYLRRLEVEYGGFFDMEYRMGGLLPSWEGFMDAANGIGKPADVATHWEELGQATGMPIDGGVWLENPLHSSFPPSLAYLAARNQSVELAQRYLRRLREMVFLEKRNIAEEETIYEAARQIGLNMERFQQDFHHPDTAERFQTERREGARFGVRGFPSLLFFSAAGDGLKVTGIQSFSTYVNALSQVLGRDVEPKFEQGPITYWLQHYPLLASKEIAELQHRSISDVEAELQALAADGKVQAHPVNDGYYWSLQ